MAPFNDPIIQKKSGKYIDCSHCAHCMEPLRTIQMDIPPKFARFCAVRGQYLMKYLYKGTFVTGIANAKTCPYFQQK
jgi:hypothetical protein